MSRVLELASQNYGVGLLTNIMPGLLTELIKKKIVPELNYDLVVDSSQVGLIKPDPAIFKLASERAQVPPENLLLVDDTRENVATAEELGWHVLWFDYARPEESVDQVEMALETA
jgi:HAD superfamily hydrolase (TIGR01509 family)